MSRGSIEVLGYWHPFTIVEHYVQEDENLTGYDLLVYMTLCYFLNAAGNCWPSVEKIASMARCSVRTCYTALHHLETLGYIKRMQRFDNGLQKTTVYQIVDRSKNVRGEDFAPPAVSVCTSCTPGMQEVQTTPAPRADRTRSNELDSENYNPPLIPPRGEAGEAASPSEPEIPGEQRMIADSPDEALAEELTQKIQADFPRADAGKLRVAVRRWIEAYGRERVEGEIPAALLLQCEKGGRYRDPVRYIGAWLRRGRKAPPPVASRIDELFEEFWTMWPGLRDGKEGARREWRRRFSALPDAAARNGALRALEPQIEALIERAERGEDLRFLGKAQNFIRDADLAG